MATTDNKLNLAQKILELQKAVRGLSKDAENKGFKYAYVSGSKLLGVVRPKMDDLGLTLTQTILPESIRLEGNTIFLVLRFVWCDAATGETKEDLWPSYGQNTSLDKAIGCAMTYSERYYLMKQLHIATDEDDVDAAEPEQPEAKPAKKATRKMETKTTEPASVAPPTPHVTMEMVVAGKCRKAVSYLAEKYDAWANDFPAADKEYIRNRYIWDDDAYDTVIDMAKFEARKKS